MSHKRRQKTCQTGKFWAMLMSIGLSLIFLSMPLYAAKPQPSPLECSISPDNGTATASLGITFSGSTSGGAKGGKTYSWDFSDGSGTPAASSANPVDVTYDSAGTYTVLLDVTDRNNAVASCSTTVTVSAAAGNVAPVAQNNEYSTQQDTLLEVFAPGVLGNDNDPDGDSMIAVLDVDVTAGTLNLSDNGSFTFEPPVGESGSYSFTYHAYDGALASNAAMVNIVVTATGAVSINSTSRSSAAPATQAVPEQDFITHPNYQLVAINDLGMHCGDLDTRISSILPPFNLIQSQVVERGINGNLPRIMGEGEVSLTYSASSNPNDPILSSSPVLAKNGTSLYKTNFWDIASEAYDPFYPSNAVLGGILGLFYPPENDNVDIGLPVPNVELFYFGEHGELAGTLHAEQQYMPGINNPLVANDPQPFLEHIGTLPFFINFPFGYTADVNWFEAPGIPLAVYDDFGRKNPYPLMRIQAGIDSNENDIFETSETIASLDVVVPISGEAECQRCHAAPDEGGLQSIADTFSDFDILADELVSFLDDLDNDVPTEASVEWASDKNILKLHDLKHGTALIVGTTQDFPTPGDTPFKATVCQTCHYTPALDLAQLGPLGPGNDSQVSLPNMDLDSLANGRDQFKHKSMSNVMHRHHGGTGLFPAMPPAVDIAGDNFDNSDPNNPIYDDNNKRLSSVTKDVLGQTCYACHPGNNTECMRGAMANGGQVCQDCHGDMDQVGDDFSNDVSPGNQGAFHLAADFYTNPDTPRVPWANEPGCGSCHTGNAIDNMTADTKTLVNPIDSAGNVDGIRLAQAFLTDDDKATPIVPVNKQFAENIVTADDNPDAAGNPKLYRVSTGHGGVFCEGCHGSTHAEWPNSNPFANDNVTANQIQGHSGTIIECQVCHEANNDASLPLGNNGPHGMHAISDRYIQVAEVDGTLQILDDGHGNVLDDPDYPFEEDLRWNTDHKSYKNDGPGCNSCHGADLKGTVLSRTAKHRVIKCKDDKGSLPGCAAGDEYTVIPKGTPVGCGLCHQQKKR